MDLNAFPDTVLRAVFDRVPLLDLIQHIPLVCHRWHSLRSSVLSQKLNKKPLALSLFVGPTAQFEPDESQVTIPFSEQLTSTENGSPMFPSPMDDTRLGLTFTLSTLTSKQVDSLIEKLRNVTFLEICIRREPVISVAMPLVIRLLDHWARSLRTLKVRYRFPESWENERFIQASIVLAQLIETVNKLSLLEHLTLDIHEDFDNMPKPLDLPILGRLKTFYFYSTCDKPDQIFDSLKRYAEPNYQLREIGLGVSAGFNEFMDKFAESPLRTRFTMLPFIGIRFTIGAGMGQQQMIPNQRYRLLSTFTEQTSFKIEMENLNFVQLTATLAPLKNLIYLQISSPELFDQYDSDPVDKIKPLPSVKVLWLIANSRNHKQLSSKHWGRMFPNLLIIRLNHSTAGCDICKFSEEGEPEKVTPCVRRTLLTFKQQFRRTLKKVYYVRNFEKRIFVFTPDCL